MRIFFLFIIITLCSCKSKVVSVDTDYRGSVSSDISLVQETIKQDTTKTEKVEQTEEFTRIIESEIVVEYDTENQAVSKVTTKEKITESGNKTQRNETENRGLIESESNKIDADIKSETKEKTETETKETSVFEGFFDNFGKWVGIGIVLCILAYLIWRKIRNKLSL